MNSFVDAIGIFFSKFPNMPDSWRRGLVKILPVITIIGLIFTALAAFSILGIILGFGVAISMSMTAPLFIALIVLLISIVLSLIALPGLVKHAEYAWKLMFYFSILSFISAVLHGSILSPVITLAIQFYLLFQIRSFYNDQAPITSVAPEKPLI